jgi:2-polyprenyl-3-methyl-5-hydroxy-6-metoxy-1,4-benzoquinol methylase
MNKQRRFLSAKELYRGWAEKYDEDPNLAIFLEEKITKYWLNVKGKEILDYGCGTGRYILKLAKNNSITAVDFSKEMLDIAKNKVKERGINAEFVLKDISKFKPNKKYDLIISMLVLDHLNNLRKVIEIMDSASKKGTDVIISNVPAYQVHRRILYEKANNPKAKINQFFHPLEEYLLLFREKGFELIDYKELVFEEKYKKMERFKEVNGSINEPYVVLMRFKKK